MSWIFRDKFVFLGLPRTASSSIRFSLFDCGYSRSQILAPGTRHLNYEELVERYPNEVGDLPVYSVLRHPLDLVITWFCLNPHITDLREFICDYSHSHYRQNGTMFWMTNVDEYLNYYVIENEMRRILENPNFRMQVLNVTQGKKHYLTYYTPELLALARKEFKDDIGEFESRFITPTVGTVLG